MADVMVTMDEHGSVHRPGAMDVRDGVIAWVGAAAEAPATADPVIGVGGLVMPGLVNTHGHTPMTLLRGAGDGLPLDRWLREAIWPREAKLTDDDVHWGMLLGCAELLRSGVTTTAEQYLHPRAVAGAVLESGIRCVLTPGIFDLPDGLTWQHCLDEAASLHAELHGRDGRLAIGLGPHAVYSVPADGLAATGKVAAELDALVQIHVAETAAEGRVVEGRHGCSAPHLLARLGVLDCRVVAAHSVWLSDDDLALFEDHDVAVAHCPQSNGKLGSGIAPVAEMLARGIRVGLGTDGPASNDNLDLWEELRLAPLLARAVSADPGALGTLGALQLATRGGADVLGVAAGSLEVGRAADFVRLDVADAAFVPGIDDRDLLAHLVWSASSRHVTDVWVAGRQVVAGGTCTTVDEGTARREVVHRARRLAGV